MRIKPELPPFVPNPRSTPERMARWNAMGEDYRRLGSFVAVAAKWGLHYTTARELILKDMRVKRLKTRALYKLLPIPANAGLQSDTD